MLQVRTFVIRTSVEPEEIVTKVDPHTPATVPQYAVMDTGYTSDNYRVLGANNANTLVGHEHKHAVKVMYSLIG